MGVPCGADWQAQGIEVIDTLSDFLLQIASEHICSDHCCEFIDQAGENWVKAAVSRTVGIEPSSLKGNNDFKCVSAQTDTKPSMKERPSQHLSGKRTNPKIDPSCFA